MSINAWIIRYQDGRYAQVWYNQDYTVFGLNPDPNIQPDAGDNVVQLVSLGGINVAFQCGGGYNAFASARYGDYNGQVQFQEPYSANWITVPQGDETFQIVPTGDGYFAIYSPTYSSYVTINPNPDGNAQNCNPLTTRGPDQNVSQAARFSALGQNRPSVLDFVQVLQNASGLSFAGVNLSSQNLSGCNLSGCDLSGVTGLSGCVLDGANLKGANLSGLQLAGVSVSGTDFTGANLSAANLRGATWTTAPILAQTNLTKAVLPTVLSGMDLHGATFSGVNMDGLTLSNANLSGADLRGAIFAPYIAPSITITQGPPAGGGPGAMAPIAGKAEGNDIARYKVVIFAHTDLWYVQPSPSAPYTDITPDGSWSSRIYLGQEYGAILVDPSSYKPPATISTLPQVGGGVLAVTTTLAQVGEGVLAVTRGLATSGTSASPCNLSGANLAGANLSGL